MDGYEDNLPALTLVLIMDYGGLAPIHGVVGDCGFLEPVIAQDPILALEDIFYLSCVRSCDVNTYSIILNRRFSISRLNT